MCVSIDLFSYVHACHARVFLYKLHMHAKLAQNHGAPIRLPHPRSHAHLRTLSPKRPICPEPLQSSPSACLGPRSGGLAAAPSPVPRPFPLLHARPRMHPRPTAPPTSRHHPRRELPPFPPVAQRITLCHACHPRPLSVALWYRLQCMRICAGDQLLKV